MDNVLTGLSFVMLSPQDTRLLAGDLKRYELTRVAGTPSKITVEDGPDSQEFLTFCGRIARKNSIWVHSNQNADGFEYDHITVTALGAIAGAVGKSAA